MSRQKKKKFNKNNKNTNFEKEQIQPSQSSVSDVIELNENLKPIDSFRTFVFAFIGPMLISMAFVICAMLFVSVVLNMEYQSISETLAFKIITSSITAISFFVIFIFYVKKYKISAFKAVKINKHISVINVFICLAIGVVAVFGVSPFVNLIDLGLAKLGFKFESLPFEINSVSTYIYAIITMALLPAIAEELIFRGLIFNGLNSKYKPVVSVGLSALFFMLIHGSIQQTFYQLLMGVVFAIVVLKTNNLIYSMIIHFVSNFSVVSIEYHLFKSQTTSLMIGSGAMQYIWPVIILIVGVGLIALLLYSIKGNAKNLNTENVIQKEEVEETKNEENNNEELEVVKNNEVEEKQNFNIKNLNYLEKTFFLVGVIFCSIMWVFNTISHFM